MEKKLYYCRYWEHVRFGEYEMCVSDIIFFKESKMAQIHILVTKNGRVVRTGVREPIYEFEDFVRQLVRNTIIKNDKATKDEAIKLWYYNIDESPIDIHDIPLRMVVTFVAGLKEYDIKEFENQKRTIYLYLQDVLKRVWNIWKISFERI